LPWSSSRCGEENFWNATTCRGSACSIWF